MSRTQRLLAEVRGRIALQAVIDDLQKSLVFGAATSLVVLAARALWLYELDILWAVIAGLVVWLSIPLARMLIRRQDPAHIAAEADRRLGLEERVSTALWCENSDPGRTSPLAHLVREDAEHTAEHVERGLLGKVFKPRLHRRALAHAGIAILLCIVVSLFHPQAHAVESDAQRTARLKDEERIARVARQLKEAAKRVQEEAKKKDMVTLSDTARVVREKASGMLTRPMDREQALTKLGDLRDLAKSRARQAAGMPKPKNAPQAAEQSRELSKLLKDLAKAGLESLQDDLEAMSKRLADGEKGDSPPSSAEMRALADRIEQLKRSIERMEGENGSRRLAEALRSLGNEDLLSDISDKLREIASKLEAGQGYESLADEGGEPMDLSDLSREELEELLEQLEELAGMEDLADLMNQAGSSARGGKRLRLRPGGSGT